MDIVDRGARKGKTLVDNSVSERSQSDLSTICEQIGYARRMQSDSKFAQAVRLAARADGEIVGRETALERVCRSQDAVARSHESEEQMALKIAKEKRRMITQ